MASILPSAAENKHIVDPGEFFVKFGASKILKIHLGQLFMKVIILLLILFSKIVLAESKPIEQKPTELDSCKQCLDRKKEICSSECELVNIKNNLICQSDCANNYCSHKCKETKKRYLELDCNKCLDQQFELCSSKTGSSRIVADYKLKCANKRCEKNCSVTP